MYIESFLLHLYVVMGLNKQHILAISRGRHSQIAVGFAGLVHGGRTYVFGIVGQTANLSAGENAPEGRLRCVVKS